MVAAAFPLQYAVCPVNTVSVEQPSASTTVSWAVYVPARAYVCVTLGEPLTDVEPSPNDHSYVATVLSTELDPDALNDDADPAGVADTVNDATGP